MKKLVGLSPVGKEMLAIAARGKRRGWEPPEDWKGVVLDTFPAVKKKRTKKRIRTKKASERDG